MADVEYVTLLTSNDHRSETAGGHYGPQGSEKLLLVECVRGGECMHVYHGNMGLLLPLMLWPSAALQNSFFSSQSIAFILKMGGGE